MKVIKIAKIKISRKEWNKLAEWTPKDPSDSLDSDSGPFYSAKDEENALLGQEESKESTMKRVFEDGKKAGLSEDGDTASCDYRQGTDLHKQWWDGYNQGKLEKEEDGKRKTFTYGMTPEELIKSRVAKEAPNGYNMTIRNQKEWKAIADAVNKGIDSHLEGFTRSKFDSRTGECLIHPEEMTTFLRRLMESSEEESMGLRMSILETLGIEEI